MNILMLTPARWEQIKQLFHAALDHEPAARPAFLARACAEDESLRQEVESLVASHEGAESFIETPASDIAAELLAGPRNGLVAGQQLGHYTVTSLLGAGGMGEVYLAEDLMLGRRVALKLLPDAFTRDGERVRRFRREARAASSLNHPNILTIYEIGEDAGRHFIATEFVEGETLRARLGGGLKLGEALDVAVQVAGALQAAHAAGVVHRDIKPENVMLRPDGLVKVLDFGLAKLTEKQPLHGAGEASTLAQINSTPGVLTGTVAYMSPEQARGLQVDERTDIWNLGVILYEMLTGGAPFKGETPADVISNILNKPAAPLAVVAPELPVELQQIIDKLLAKDREERYQTAKDMLTDLRQFNRHLEFKGGSERSVPPEGGGGVSTNSGRGAAATAGDQTPANTAGAAAPTSSADYVAAKVKRHVRGALLGGAALVIALGVGFGLYKFSGQKNSPFQNPNIVKLTTTGDARSAALSPDGKYVAYVTEESGREGLWVRQVAVANSVRIVAPAEVEYRGLTFSRDGTYIFYVAATKSDGGRAALYQVPALGGSARKVKEGVDGPAGLSVDGKQFAFVRKDSERGEEALLIAGVDGGGERRVASRKFPDHFSVASAPAWSPDAETIACVVESVDANGFFMSATGVRVADGTDRPLSTKRWSKVDQMAWLPDGGGLVAAAQDADSSFQQLWHISYPEGRARKIISDPHDYKGVSLPADAGALVTVQSQTLTSIWVAPKGEFSRPAQITSGAGSYIDLSWTPDGKLIYASDASGNADIWEMEADGTEQKQLTAGAGRNYAPAASSDGRYIVFHSDRSGTWQIWRMNRDGSDPVQLTGGEGSGNWPQVSPDGLWVIYEHLGAGRSGLWRVRYDGGAPVSLTDGLSTRPAFSPDGKLIAYWHKEREPNAPWRIAVTPSEGGRPIKLFDVLQSPAIGQSSIHWTPDGHAVVFTDFRNGVTNLRMQPVDGGPPKQLTDFTNGQFYSFDFARDGRLGLIRGSLSSDVVLISDFK